jgi:hypothetical protein
MSLITPSQSLCTAPLLLELTKWRNHNSPVLVTISKRLISEVGYALLAVAGAVEGVTRIIFASIAYFISELPINNAPRFKAEVVTPLYEGIALNLGCSLLGFFALFYNPFSKTLSLDNLRETFLPCFPNA